MKPFFVFAAVFLLAGGISFVNAQDIIVMKNGDEIEAKVLEISPTEIRYKRFDNLEGPTMVVPASDVFMIRYENGTRQVINADTADASTGRQDYPADAKAKRAIDNKWPAFALNLFLGVGIGSFVQGDTVFGVVALFGELINVGSLLLANNEVSLYISIVGLSIIRITELIRPFVYADKFSVAFSPSIDNKGQPALAVVAKLKL